MGGSHVVSFRNPIASFVGQEGFETEEAVTAEEHDAIEHVIEKAEESEEP